ncbi:hypothetical protein KAH81_08085 [bacterium]|nr:hypothetical protein [bacterium]
MNRHIGLTIILTLFLGVLYGFSVNGHNSLEFRIASSDSSDEFFENRFDFRVSESFFTLGARFDAMHPSRSSAVTRPTEEYNELVHRWARVSIDDIEITAGTIMESFGNGLILDARERTEIQEDKHLDGISLALSLPYSSLNFIGGIANWNEQDNYTIKGLDYITYEIPFVNIGAGYIAFKDKLGEADSLLSDLEGEIWGLRAMPEFGPFYGEFSYSRMWRDNIESSDFIDGNILYSNASFYFGPFVFFGEFIQADSFSARGYSDDSWLVSLPLIVHQPSYTLMSRHIQEIDPINTRAFSGEASYGFDHGDFSVSTASVGDIEGEDDAYIEVYGEAYLDFDRLSTRIVVEYQDLSGDDNSINVVLEPLCYVSDRASILLDIEFQTGVEYGEDVNNFYGLGELSLSPYGSVGIEGGKIGEEGEAFARAYVDFALGESHKVTLAYGKRPGGFTCSGGSCRFEPEFEGFEFKLVSNF